MSTGVVKRSYRYRLYPNRVQVEQLSRTFGCVRFVWNRVLDERTRRYRVDGVSTSYADSSRMLTALKKTPEASFLNEVSSVPAQQTLRHQSAAFQAFFEGRARYPRFKRKHRGTEAAEYTRSGFKLEGTRLRLARIDGPVTVRWSRPLPGGAYPSTVTVSRDRAGRWFVSMLVETTAEPLPPVDRAVGVDLGVKTWAVVADDIDAETIDLPGSLATAQRRVTRAQKRLSRTRKGSHRRAKARERLARAHARVADIRTDFLHQTSTRLVRDNQTVVVEDLAVKAMTRSTRGTVEAPGHRVAQKAGLNRRMLDGAWAEFRRQLEYKTVWYGRDLVVADRWFPSSKTCSSCGYLLDKLSLSTRRWTCPGCGAVHDRDVNAARNLRAFALGLREKQNARGGPVRPLGQPSGTAR